MKTPECHENHTDRVKYCGEHYARSVYWCSNCGALGKVPADSTEIIWQRPKIQMMEDFRVETKMLLSYIKMFYWD